MKTKALIQERIELANGMKTSKLDAVRIEIEDLDDTLLAKGDALEEETLEALHAQSEQVSAKWQAYIDALKWVLE